MSKLSPLPRASNPAPPPPPPLALVENSNSENRHQFGINGSRFTLQAASSGSSSWAGSGKATAAHPARGISLLAQFQTSSGHLRVFPRFFNTTLSGLATGGARGRLLPTRYRPPCAPRRWGGNGGMIWCALCVLRMQDSVEWPLLKRGRCTLSCPRPNQTGQSHRPCSKSSKFC